MELKRRAVLDIKNGLIKIKTRHCLSKELDRWVKLMQYELRWKNWNAVI
ncbi:MAG: hypothetical protein K6G84_05670 [Lachnospiraceae bacterium]|nr:hypothetical protein [Lachnospiraceae bacterium]